MNEQTVSLADLLRNAKPGDLDGARLLLGGEVYMLDKWELVKGSCDREEFRSSWHPLPHPGAMGLLRTALGWPLANSG